MNNVCFVNFYKNQNGLWETRYNAESRLYEKYLKSKGINSYAYFEKDITSVVDIAEDITSFSDEAIIFITDNNNLFLNLSLAKQVENEEPDCVNIFLCSEMIKDGYKKYPKEEYIYIYKDHESELCKALDVEYNDDNLFSEEYHQFDDENDLYKFTENPEVLIGREVNGKITSRNINAVLNDVDVICMYSE